MTYENFKHIDPDEFHGKELTLHDCIADKIWFEKNTLRFYLPDGFWVTTHHQENPSGKTVRTDAAVVAFSVEDMDDITVRVFTRDTWCWSKKNTRGKLAYGTARGSCKQWEMHIGVSDPIQKSL